MGRCRGAPGVRGGVLRSWRPACCRGVARLSARPCRAGGPREERRDDEAGGGDACSGYIAWLLVGPASWCALDADLGRGAACACSERVVPGSAGPAAGETPEGLEDALGWRERPGHGAQPAQVRAGQPAVVALVVAPALAAACDGAGGRSLCGALRLPLWPSVWATVWRLAGWDPDTSTRCAEAVVPVLRPVLRLTG